MIFIDDVRYASLEEDKVGPEFGDMVSFFSGSPELCRKPKVLTMFQLSCVFLPHVPLDILDVRFGSPTGVGDELDLPKLIGPVQTYLLFSYPECKIFTDSVWISDSVEIPKNFAWIATEAGHNP